MFCRVDIKEVSSLKYTFDIECTPTFKILIAEQQVLSIPFLLSFSFFFFSFLFLLRALYLFLFLLFSADVCRVISNNSCLMNNVYCHYDFLKFYS